MTTRRPLPSSIISSGHPTASPASPPSSASTALHRSSSLYPALRLDAAIDTMDDRHQPGPVDAGVEAQRERRAARRQELARRAAEGNSLPAASTTSRTRRLFLFDGPDYEWEEGHVLTMSFRAGEKSYSVDLQTAGITERELRRACPNRPLFDGQLPGAGHQVRRHYWRN